MLNLFLLTQSLNQILFFCSLFNHWTSRSSLIRIFYLLINDRLYINLSSQLTTISTLAIITVLNFKHPWISFLHQFMRKCMSPCSKPFQSKKLFLCRSEFLMFFSFSGSSFRIFHPGEEDAYLCFLLMILFKSLKSFFQYSIHLFFNFLQLSLLFQLLSFEFSKILNFGHLF